jgi:hypothetical protein
MVENRTVIAVALLAVACAVGKTSPSQTRTTAAAAASLPPSTGAYAYVIQAASCWTGGLWSDALGETGVERQDGIDRRCDELMYMSGALPAGVYYPLRAIDPDLVDDLAKRLEAMAARDPAEAAHTGELVALFRAIAAAARETLQGRRAADEVKDEAHLEYPKGAREHDKRQAGAYLQQSEALASLGRLGGTYAAEARAMYLLEALDRMEIARGLPKHLKIYAVQGGFAGVFGVQPPVLDDDAALPIKTGTWLGYLSAVAAAAGHPVPASARLPEARQPAAWAGVLEGFADKLRASRSALVRESSLKTVLGAAAARLTEEYKSERAALK